MHDAAHVSSVYGIANAGNKAFKAQIVINGTIKITPITTDTITKFLIMELLPMKN